MSLYPGHFFHDEDAMLTTSERARSNQWLLIGLVGALVAAAWWSLTPVSAVSSGAHAHHHQSPAGGTEISMAQIGFFGASWTVMTVAMMLPTTLPLVTIFHRIAGGKKLRLGLVTLLIVGYLVIWALVGIVVDFGLIVVPALTQASPRFAQHAWMGGGLVLLVAGLYQFTSLKHRCLEKCRSPLSFVIQHWRGQREAWQAFQLGLHHGLFCVGCCWTLMLLMVGVGLSSLGWMLLLGAVMAVEKNVPWGNRLSAPIGFGLIAWGSVALWTA
jgi:predicted metal-binding membrane protein